MAASTAWFAHQHLLPRGVNHNTGGNVPRFFVVHIMVGFMAGTDSVFHNPNFQASAHFGVSRAGEIWQWVRTEDQAWHAYDANNCSIAVEHEGFPTNKLSKAQVAASGRLFEWVNRQYPAVKLWENKRLSGSGIAYHEQYNSWNRSGHSCPGKIIEAQIPDILAAAQAVRKARKKK